MHRDGSRKTVLLTVKKRDDGWYVMLPDGNRLGPYLNGKITLKVAVTHIMLARKRGLNAQIAVEDEAGESHHCMIIDWVRDPHRCRKCESAWNDDATVSKCPLRREIDR